MFTNKISDILGGNPIESSKTMVLVLSWDKLEMLAAEPFVVIAELACMAEFCRQRVQLCFTLRGSKQGGRYEPTQPFPRAVNKMIT